MIDLSTTYLGLKLATPLVVSSNPLCREVDSIRQLEAAGAGAVVLPSLFEEQIEIEDLGLQHSKLLRHEEWPEALRHIPEMTEYNRGVDGYLTSIFRAKRAVKIPVIASLNGTSLGGWARYAKLLQAAGADALELNVYYLPTQPYMTGQMLEERYVDLVRTVCGTVDIPVAVKISPYLSSVPNLAHQFEQIGARGLVLFNRFYQPDFDLETETVASTLQLSTPAELLLRLRWTALLHGQTHLDLAVTGGVHSGADALKALLAGARVAMVASALLQHGPTHLTTILDEMREWMTAHQYQSADQLRGRLSPRHTQRTAEFERANYINVLKSYGGDA